MTARLATPGAAFYIGAVGLVLIGFMGNQIDKLRAEIRVLEAYQRAPITIGDPNSPTCNQTVPAEVWERMNAIGFYRWIVACEEAVEKRRLEETP